jgi:hypothetical protein
MKKFHLMALPLAAALALPVMAQNSMPPAPPSNTSTTTDSSQNTQQQPTTNSTDQTNQNQNTQSQTTDQNQQNNVQNNPNANTADQNLQARQPLQQQTHEGFWGHLNPFARKKYVQRQLTPVRDRLNELDELSPTTPRRSRTLTRARPKASVSRR